MEVIPIEQLLNNNSFGPFRRDNFWPLINIPLSALNTLNTPFTNPIINLDLHCNWLLYKFTENNLMHCGI